MCQAEEAPNWAFSPTRGELLAVRTYPQPLGAFGPQHPNFFSPSALIWGPGTYRGNVSCDAPVFACFQLWG